MPLKTSSNRVIVVLWCMIVFVATVFIYQQFITPRVNANVTSGASVKSVSCYSGGVLIYHEAKLLKVEDNTPTRTWSFLTKTGRVYTNAECVVTPIAIESTKQ